MMNGFRRMADKLIAATVSSRPVLRIYDRHPLSAGARRAIAWLLSWIGLSRLLFGVLHRGRVAEKGIAAALRRGLEFAMREGADFCLTMDQDSAFPVERMGEIERWLSMPDIDDYGIIALNYEQSGGAGLVVVPTWITSGNFVNVRNYRLIAGFREELFIDSVDHELCHQFYCIGKKVAYIADIPMQHALGNMSYVSLFGRKLSLTNHSPLRYYYRFRNNYVLYREDKAFYRGLYRADRHQLIKIMLFEKNRREKWRMIRRGIRDAKRGVLGKYAP